MNSERTCGDCNVCCYAAAVPEMKKHKFVRCEHMIGSKGGCAIYPDRPPSCRNWKCEWLEGMGEDEDRPDKLGVMFMLVQTREGLGTLIFEVVEGAKRSERFQVLYQKACAKVPVFQTTPGDQSDYFLGGPHEIAERILNCLITE